MIDNKSGMWIYPKHKAWPILVLTSIMLSSCKRNYSYNLWIKNSQLLTLCTILKPFCGEPSTWVPKVSRMNLVRSLFQSVNVLWIAKMISDWTAFGSMKMHRKTIYWNKLLSLFLWLWFISYICTLYIENFCTLVVPILKRKVSVLEKNSSPILISKLDLGFGSRYQNLVSVAH